MTIRLALICVVLGAVGFAVMWCGWHLWQDHQNFHAVLNFLQQQAASAQKATPK